MEGFSIDTGQTVHENVTRILLDEMDFIQTHCIDHPDAHYSIHEIRKSCKRIRAVLRMIRDATGYSSYYRENIFYRNLSRLFSKLRDFEVMINSLDEINENNRTGMEKIHFDNVKKHLESERDKLYETIMRDEDLFKKVAGTLVSGRERLPIVVPDNLDVEKCSSGLRRTYKSSKALKQEAFSEGTMEVIHKFRKRAKYLQYIIQMLIPIYPDLLDAFVKSMKKLTDALGVYRDLGMLDHYLKNHRITGFPATQLKVLSELINSESAMIYTRSMHHAALVFTEDTDSFINRIMAYWIYHQIK